MIIIHGFDQTRGNQLLGGCACNNTREIQLISINMNAINIIIVVIVTINIVITIPLNHLIIVINHCTTPAEGGCSSNGCKWKCLSLLPWMLYTCLPSLASLSVRFPRHDIENY